MIKSFYYRTAKEISEEAKNATIKSYVTNQSKFKMKVEKRRFENEKGKRDST